MRIKIILFLILGLLSIFASRGASNKETSFILNLEPDYSIIESESGAAVLWNERPAIYDDDTDAAGLPMIPMSIDIPTGYCIHKFEYKIISKELIFRGKISTNPYSISTYTGDIDFSNSGNAIIESRQGQIRLGNQIETRDGSSKANILVSPFEYNLASEQLYYCAFEISLQLRPNVHKTVHKANTIVPEDIKSYFNKVLNLKLDEDDPDYLIDYVIVTRDVFADEFERLVKWKRTKGLKCLIFNLDEFERDIQNPEIKKEVDARYLQSLLGWVHAFGARYILIGGDDTIIPAAKCYGRAHEVEDKFIPTDFYYSCFDYSYDILSDEFHWDKNKNGIIGEPEDISEFDSDVAIARIPVRTASEMRMAVDKILRYEQNPKYNGWNNCVLTAGEFKDFDTSAEKIGNYIYTNGFRYPWNGKRIKYYDTCPISDNGNVIDFTSGGLFEEMRNGYSFMQVIGKGNQTSWEFSDGKFLYLHANALNSPQLSIITSPSGFVNAFDTSDGTGRTPNIQSLNSDKCLGEWFIHNERTNVVAFLGNSREAWFYTGQQYSSSPSLQFEKLFYQALFSTASRDKSFGELVRKVKTEQLGDYPYWSEAYRWLLFSINAIGDPEMPIYTGIPKDWNGTTFSVSNGSVRITTPNPDGKIGFYSTDEISDPKRKNLESGNFTYNIEKNTSFCLMDMDYIPFRIKCGLNSIQLSQQVYTGNHVFNADSVIIGSDVPEESVCLTDGVFNFITSELELRPGVYLEKNVEIKVSK